MGVKATNRAVLKSNRGIKLLFLIHEIKVADGQRREIREGKPG